VEYFHRNVFSYSALYRKHAPERTVKHFPSGLRDAKRDGNDSIFDKFIASGQGVNANDGLALKNSQESMQAIFMVSHSACLIPAHVIRTCFSSEGQ
jgi:hypothetical protein